MLSISESSLNAHSTYDFQNKMKCTQEGPQICTPFILFCKFLHKLARTTIQTRVYGNSLRGRLTAENETSSKKAFFHQLFPEKGKSVIY